MFKIGEFSKVTQVSIRMLRYYDEQNLIKPQKIDPYSGYRMYSADQIEELNRIILLRDMGFGVDEMKCMLKEWNTQNVRQCLQNQMDKATQIIKAEELKRKQMQEMMDELDHPEQKCNIDIVLKQLPMQQVASMRKTVSDYYCEGQMWQEFFSNIENVKEVKKLQSFSVYHDLDFKEKDVDIEICVNTNGTNIRYRGDSIILRQIPEVRTAACFYVYGSYSNIGKAYREFGYWLEKHPEYRMLGENRQICHVSACNTENQENFVTELQIPLNHLRY